MTGAEDKNRVPSALTAGGKMYYVWSYVGINVGSSTINTKFKKAYPACALRALGLLLADSAPTVGGGKIPLASGEE